MKPIEIGDILDIAQYERIREEFRREIIALKKTRQVAVGERITFSFENRLTVRFQIQEMTRTERIVKDEAIQEEIDVYNELIPPPGSLSATMFIEFTDLSIVREQLRRLLGIDQATFLELPSGERVPVEYEPGRQTETRLSAVQYVRISLSPDQVAAFKSAPGDVTLVIDHPAYPHRTLLSPETRRELAADLS